jgi:DNA polymerase I
VAEGRDDLGGLKPDAQPLLVIVDGNNFFWRSYHALKVPLSNELGEETFAVHGTITVIAKLMKRLRPRYVLAAFDMGRSAFRSRLYPQYKGPIDKVLPEEKTLAADQRETTIKLLKLMGMAVVRQPSVEADDIIATAVKRFSERARVVIASGDKDLLQLVNDRVEVFSPALGPYRAEKFWNHDEVVLRYGVPPQKLVEVWALTGDDIDNVPGVRGVGEKTAVKFIQKHGTAFAASMSEEKLRGSEALIARAWKMINLDGTVANLPDLSLEDLEFIPTLPGSQNGKSVVALLDQLELEQLKVRWFEGRLWTPPIGRRLTLS